MNGKRSKVIGFDFDDVLFNFNDALFPYHNDRFGTTYEREQIKSLNFSELWDCNQDEVTEKVLDFYKSEEHENALPVEGAFEVIQNLSNYHNLFIITARHEEIRDKTVEWLEKHFPKMFKEIHFTNHFTGNGPRRPKSEVCQELGIEVFVDDSIHNAEDVASCGIPVLLFDTPWNQAEVGPSITRVYSWEDIKRYIDS